MSMTCKLYNFLFRVLPVNAWKVRLMDNHLAICPRCGENVEKIEGLLVSLEDSTALPALWPGLQTKMAEDERGRPVPERKLLRPVFHKWQWAAAAAVLVLIAVLIPLSFGPGAGPGNGENGNQQVIVESVKVNSRAADVVYFNSKDPDKLIVWVKK
ncbi:MAG: hypothetical protein GY950_02765 [bacterium]|nr:hypothetical protein [bacterium]